MSLHDAWQAVLDNLEIRHPDPTTEVGLTLHGDEPYLTLHVMLNNLADTANPATRINGFNVGMIQIDYWPGPMLASMWLAAAWAGYLQHEALELVRWRGQAFNHKMESLGYGPLHPHATLRGIMQSPEERAHDRGSRDGWPSRLTPKTLVTALAVVMPVEVAQRLVDEHAPLEVVVMPVEISRAHIG